VKTWMKICILIHVLLHCSTDCCQCYKISLSRRLLWVDLLTEAWQYGYECKLDHKTLPGLAFNNWLYLAFHVALLDCLKRKLILRGDESLASYRRARKNLISAAYRNRYIQFEHARDHCLGACDRWDLNGYCFQLSHLLIGYKTHN
jgi:hypothetical protein